MVAIGRVLCVVVVAALCVHVVMRPLLLQLERQIQMQATMRERMMAQQIAMGRIRTYYYGTFYALATLGLTSA